MSGYHKNEVYALLNDKGIPYEAVEHEAVFTMEEMLMAASAKTSFCATQRAGSIIS